jgi:hypothetical protein
MPYRDAAAEDLGHDTRGGIARAALRDQLSDIEIARFAVEGAALDIARATELAAQI